ncbi:MAG: NAD(P)-dependent alcohol dehydrogenase [Sandaracinaceae bacterium]
MLAWQIEGGFGLDHLTLTEREAPTPGPGQARVKMSAWSLNYRDYLVITGGYNPRQKLPLVPLSDAAGVVDAVGEGVRRVKVGNRVAPTFAQRWIAGQIDRERQRSALGSPGDGVAAEQVVFDAEGLVHVPSHLGDDEAATLPCAGVTAWTALYEQGDLRPGQTVLVQGTGGVSIFGLLLARLGGARVLCTSSSDEKLAIAEALGATWTVNYRDDPDWGKTARDLTGGVDHVIEVGGAGTIEQSLIAVKPGGTVNVIGVLDGVGGELQLTRVLMNAVRMQGILVGPREAFERMNAAMEAAQLRPVLDAKRFSFEALPDALAHMRDGAHFGKIAITR